MSGQISAEVSHWYRPQEGQKLFEVVAIDFDDQSIEIQYFDGSVEEMGFGGWKTLVPIESPPPEDWSNRCKLERADPSFDAYAMSEALLRKKPFH